MQNITAVRGYPGPLFTGVLLALLALAMLVAIALLLNVEDPIRLKQLIEDDGPVQGVGLVAITLAFSLSLWFTLSDGLGDRLLAARVDERREALRRLIPLSGHETSQGFHRV